MEVISLIKTPDGNRKILHGKTKVINIECVEGTTDIIKDLTSEQVNKILDSYYPQDCVEGNCIIENPLNILKEK